MAAEKPDLVFTWTPPILMGIVARFAAWRFRVPCVVNVQDLFPQALIDLGVLRNRPLIRCFEAMERFVYRTADAITVMSDGNREYLIGKGTRPDKVHTVFNWVDTASIRPGDRMNPFRASHGMHDEFVVLFAGTMGLAQGLSTVVDAARLLVNEPDLLFLLVGDGVDRGPLERRAAGAANVRFLPMQPKETYPQVLASADACLATLKPEVATPTVPSKIATIMAAGRPLLASLPPGDAPRLIRDARAGIVVPAGDAEALANAVLTLKRDREAAKTMGIRGRSYAEKHLSRLACIRRLVEILTRVAPSTATGENGRN
jgi:glycosyltransferase involved in cell wall biosynthesis